MFHQLFMRKLCIDQNSTHLNPTASYTKANYLTRRNMHTRLRWHCTTAFPDAKKRETSVLRVSMSSMYYLISVVCYLNLNRDDVIFAFGWSLLVNQSKSRHAAAVFGIFFALEARFALYFAHPCCAHNASTLEAHIWFLCDVSPVIRIAHSVIHAVVLCLPWIGPS